MGARPRGAQQTSEGRNRNAARRLREKKSKATAQPAQQGHRAQGHGRGDSGQGRTRRRQQRGRGEPAVAQVVKRDAYILQDGRVVEAVCMECTNCGGGYEVSPQQSMRAASRGFPPRKLCYECTEQAKAAAQAAYEEKLKERRTLSPGPLPSSERGGEEVKAGAGGDEHESLPTPDFQSLAQDLQRQQQDLQRQLQDLQRRLAAAEEDAAEDRREAATEAAKLLGREDRPVAGQPPRSGGGSSGAGQSTAKETQPDACAGACSRPRLAHAHSPGHASS